MLMEFAPRIVGALFFAFFVAGIARLLVRPTPHLAERVRPYTASSRSSLGRNPDRALTTGQSSSAPVRSYNVAQRLYRPLVVSLVDSLRKVFGSAFDDETLTLRLRQAGLMTDVPEGERVHEYRIRQVGGGLAWAAGFGVLAAVAGAGGAVALLAFVLGGVCGVARRSGGVGKRIENRRERMRIELYTVNQLLAIYLRTSGSPVLAAQRLVRRGSGLVIAELDEAMRLHTRGMSASRAFARIADQTPEPFAARTYKLLSSGSERGADLAGALLSLSEDVRDDRRTSLRRNATKRQAALLLPIIVFLAPVMLLFIGAPLPSMVFPSGN